MKKNASKTGLIFFISTLIFILGSLSFAEIEFTGADINKNGDILFSTKQKSSCGQPYNTLFLYTKNNKKIKQLTIFPESLKLVSNKRYLQVSNSNSFLKIDLFNGTIYSQSEFENASPMRNMKIGGLKNMQSSPDGRWITLIEPISQVFGSLILIDTKTDRRYILSDRVLKNANAINWSPDSQTFLYEEEGIIYFARTSWFSFTKPPAKKFRRLAKGSIKHLRWTSNNDFVFLSGKILYKINTNELFTKSFYTPLFPLGELIARLPVDFNPVSDKVFIAPNAKSAVFIKNRRNVYYFSLNGDDYTELQDEGSIPFLLLPGNTAEISVHWKNNLPIVFAEALSNGKITINAWQIFNSNKKFKKLPLRKNSKFLAASPNFKTVAIKQDDTVAFYNTDLGWKKVASFYDEEIISAVWLNDEVIFLGGENALIKYTLQKNKSHGIKQRLYLTGLKDFSWSKNGDKILLEITDAYQNEIVEYANNFKLKATSNTALRRKSNSNSKDRIYIDSSNSYFKNMLFIRSLEDYSTKALFQAPMAFSSKPSANTYLKYSNTSSIFSHGKRDGKKQVALVFDAMDNMDGIAKVLYILKKNNIKATFFINGEALRQNPNAVKEIVKAGHQCGSLFFTTWNLSDPDYRIDEKFIKKGLARNEDNFYSVTGSELSLIWHSPYYIASTMMINAGKKAGYIYISPDIRIPDWLSSENKKELKALDVKAPVTIEKLCSYIAPGSIIPINLSQKSADKSDVVYSYLQVLIDALKEMGYSITDLEHLMKN